MKIGNEYIQKLQQQGVARKGRAEAGNGFGDLLARQVEKEQGACQGPAPLQGNHILRTEALMQLRPAEGRESVPEEGFMRHVDNLLMEWENYAHRLEGRSPGNLKDAYSALESIAGEVDRLKSAMAETDAPHPGLSDLVNELEVLHVTETYKFNRGDYF